MDLKAIGNLLTLEAPQPLTSNSVNVFRAAFDFDAAWDGMARTAVFRTPLHNVAVLLDDTGICVIPHEVLDAGFDMSVAVFGVLDGTTVLATNYVNTGPVLRGADTEAPEGTAPTPGQYEQLLAEINKVRGELGDIVAAGGFVTQDILTKAMEAVLNSAMKGSDAAGSAKKAYEAAVKAASDDATKKASAAAEAAIEAAAKDAEEKADAALKAAKDAALGAEIRGAADGVASLGADRRHILSELTKGLEIVDTLNNTYVGESTWMANTNEKEPAFRASVQIALAQNLALTDPIVEILFNVADATSGVFSSVAQCDYRSYASPPGYFLTLYAFEKPVGGVSIPLIRLRRCVR